MALLLADLIPPWSFSLSVNISACLVEPSSWKHVDNRAYLHVGVHWLELNNLLLELRSPG